jgi:uncharacterized integral membrane protein
VANRDVESSGSPPRDRKRDTRLVLLGVAAVLLIWFALANLKSVQIHFWVVSTRHTPLIVVIVISGLLGAALALLATRNRRKPAEKDH